MNIRYILLIVSMLLAFATASAGDFASGGLVYSFTNDDDQVAVDCNIVDGVNAYQGVIIIPPMVNYEGYNYKVTSIAKEAFAQSMVTEVVIPNSVKKIGEAAFAGADDLTSVTLPLNLKVIPEACFAGTSIVNIALPEGVETIGYGAFQSCSLLHTVMMPSTLKLIEAYAFNYCHNLYEIYCAATKPPRATGWAIFTGVKGVDLVVADYDAMDAYSSSKVWGDEDTFTLFPNEDIAPQLTFNPHTFNQDWQRVDLGNYFAYKVLGDDDELLAFTAADHFYLPASDHDVTYTIVPTTMMGDADPVYFTVEATTGINNIIDDAFPAEPEPIIVAHQGTLYIYGDNYRKWVSVWDMNGRLYYQRISSDAQVIDLPRNRVYIVRVGNYVKKIFV